MTHHDTTYLADISPEMSQWTGFFVPPGGEITRVLYVPEPDDDTPWHFEFDVDYETPPTGDPGPQLMDKWFLRGYVSGGEIFPPSETQTMTDVNGVSFQLYRVGPTLVEFGGDEYGMVDPDPNRYLKIHPNPEVNDGSTSQPAS